MVAMVTIITETIVSIITSYHGYSGFCISVLEVVTGSIDALNLQRNICALCAYENRQYSLVNCFRFVLVFFACCCL